MQIHLNTETSDFKKPCFGCWGLKRQLQENQSWQSLRGANTRHSEASKWVSSSLSHVTHSYKWSFVHPLDKLLEERKRACLHSRHVTTSNSASEAGCDGACRSSWGGINPFLPFCLCLAWTPAYVSETCDTINTNADVIILLPRVPGWKWLFQHSCHIFRQCLQAHVSVLKLGILTRLSLFIQRGASHQW